MQSPEDALWSRMARNAGGRGMADLAVQYQDHSDESEQRAGIIRRVLMPEADGVPGEDVSAREASGARRRRS